MTSPRVVVFRANAIDTDSRGKKVALTLARLGYDVVVLSAADGDPTPSPDRWLVAGAGQRVRVVTVPIGRRARDDHRNRVGNRRLRRLQVLDTATDEEVTTRVLEWRAAARGPLAPYYWARIGTRTARHQIQRTLTVGHRFVWRGWDAVRARSTLGVTTRGMLPEVEDYARAFGRALDEAAPDLIHVHHPLVLGTAVRAARRRRAAGATCRVIYDAREDFAGLPVQERGSVRRHAAVVAEEARHIRSADAVVTVSEPIADTLQRRYRLPARPAVVLNVPVPPQPPDGDAPPANLRVAAGLGDAVPLVVYSGAVSRARGVDRLVDALAHLDGVHAAVVAVPFPHPHAAAAIEAAERLGVADRLHWVPPVDQDALIGYLAGADVAVMPLRTGSANIDQALPNKLFENLHARLTMVTSDAALMAAFVREHDLGEVYQECRDSTGAAGADLAARSLAGAVRAALDHPRDTHGAAWDALCRRYRWAGVEGQEGALRALYRALATPPTPDGIDHLPYGSLAVLAEAASVGATPAVRGRSA